MPSKRPRRSTTTAWRAGRPRPQGLLALAIALLWVAGFAAAAAAGPLTRFLDRTLAEGQDARDSLAAGFNPAQLPLIAAALAADPRAHGVDPDRVYAALTRWHFWTGRRWDHDQSGLWSIDPGTLPGSAAQRGQVVAAHASLELVQLAALARLATANGHAYDALVWWSDHARLRTRLDQRLYDPLRGGHTDLDSVGVAMDRLDLDALLPIAVGADLLPELARTMTWRLLTDGEPQRAPDPASLVTALDRVDALHGWTTSPGLRLFEPAVTATLLHAGVRALADPVLELVLRDALSGVGLAPGDSIRLRMGAWTPQLAVRDLAPRPFDRARAGVLFLDRAGVLTNAETDSLRAVLDSTADEAGAARAAERLTAALGRWRALDARADRFLWEGRRADRPAPNGPGASFRFQEGDLAIWVRRAVESITEDVIAHHLRRQERASWRAAVQPAVAGRGDPVELVLLPDGRPVAGEGEEFEVSALWTDGLRLLSPRIVTLRGDGSGAARGALGGAPEEIGIWRLVLEGLPASVRAPAAVAVVEPLQMNVAAVSRRGSVATMRVEVTSQVTQTTAGRVEVQPPLSFTVTPTTRLEFDLEGGGTQAWDLSFTPAGDDAPALYRVQWLLFDRTRQIGAAEDVVAVPFQWLRLGPLPQKGNAPIDTRYPPDEQVELARRFTGAQRAVGWNRMPMARVSADGWVRMATAEDPAGVHYAFTAFTTGTREARVRLESDGPALLRVNGREAVRTPDWGGQDRGEIRFGAGINFVLVKIVGGGGSPGRFRLDLLDIDGEPLRGVSNSLDLLLDEMAYLARTDEGDAAERAVDRESMRLMPFTYSNPAATSVSVVGSFNGWSPTATRMVQLEDGRWQAKVRLRPGRFEYKFAVNGDQWIADPANPESVSDGFGGLNSLLVVE